ncbi:MAG TPA: hypothetical protein VGE86_06510, partial [Thermoanaerobaculia bacterium]
AAEPPAPAPRSAPADGDLAARLVAHIAKNRRAAATYLESARSIALDGDVLVIEFDAANRFAAEYLAEQTSYLAEAAQELAGRPVRVTVRMSDDGPKAAAMPAKPAAAQDDPVLRSFQKHLGGEVVSRGSRRKNQEES